MADCTDPVGIGGDVVFNGGDAVMQYCNDAEWVGFPKREAGNNPCTGTGEWKSNATPNDPTFTSVAYGNGVFAAVTFNSGDRILATSPNGVDWAYQLQMSGQWVDVIYGGGQFVAVAHWVGSADMVATSPDGIVWTIRQAATVGNWKGIAYGDGLYAALGSGILMTSPDGYNWTAGTPASGTWYAITYGNGTFVAVGNGVVMTSVDGINWTLGSMPGGWAAWTSVTYGNGTFVAVASSHSGSPLQRVMTSPDGITWTRREATEDNAWQSVTYGNGLFVAVASNGTNRVMTSPDGITWTAQAAAAANAWQSVTYGEGHFVAVGDSGTNRAMTAKCLRPGCNGPEAPTGTMAFNADHRVVQWCDGSAWHVAGPPDPGGPNADCVNPAKPGGYLLFNQEYRVLQYCDGDAWRTIGKFPCQSGAPALGTVCADGTIYAGLSPDGNEPMYAAAADAPSTLAWGPMGTDTAIVNCTGTETSCTTGEANTALLAGLGSGYAAATYCATLGDASEPEAHGHDDWYLPAQNELDVVYDNLGPEPNNNFQSSVYWSSTEDDTSIALTQNFTTGGHGVTLKSGALRVRCVRR